MLGDSRGMELEAQQSLDPVRVSRNQYHLCSMIYVLHYHGVESKAQQSLDPGIESKAQQSLDPFHRVDT